MCGDRQRDQVGGISTRLPTSDAERQRIRRTKVPAEHALEQAKECGAVLITVMVVMAMVLLFGTSIANHLLTTEADAVEEELVKARVYWAMMGHLNYMLSRARGEGLCGSDLSDALTTECSADDGDEATANSRIQVLASYENEINDATQTYRTWTFDTQYFFRISGTVQNRLAPNDGLMFINLAISAGPPNIAPAVAGLDNRHPDLRVGLCVVDQGPGGIGDGYDDDDGDPGPTDGDSAAVNSTTSCDPNVDRPDIAEGRSRFQFVRWAP